MWVQNPADVILMVIVCEAIVNLIFTGTVLQPLREQIIRYTPFLSVRGEHLLTCKICTSLWVGLLTVGILQFSHIRIIWLLALGIAVHRLSNYLHLGFSLIKDFQFNIRVNRGKGDG
jgi:hypothetical protein